MNIANSKCERTKPRTTPEKCGWYIRLLNVFKFALLFTRHPLNLHHVSEFYMGMSKNFEYLSVSKGHHKASLGSAQNSTFVARVNFFNEILSNVRVYSRPRVFHPTVALATVDDCTKRSPAMMGVSKDTTSLPNSVYSAEWLPGNFNCTRRSRFYRTGTVVFLFFN